MKLDGSVGTYVRLIVLKLNKNWFIADVMTSFLIILAFFFFAKGENSVVKSDLTIIVYLTWNRAQR